ncbi:extracellular solute-binding protein [Actinoplanes sp. NPDC051851]|uniref:ABC transporter substrate-binding protein n=1 Tax=Actinoplanes sp. NPDC051851 TaxID=3154753 RepID=UPI0034186BB6
MAISAALRKGSMRVLAAGAASVLALSACSSGSDDSGDAKSITFWYSTSAQDQGYADLAKEFEAKEGIKVEIVNIPSDGYQDKLQQAAQANALPDTASVPSLDPLWVNQVQDLSNIVSDTTTQINTNLITKDGDKVLAIPSDVTAAGLFINKSLFEKAGVEYPTDPAKTWTWDEFLAAADKVKAATGAKYDLVYDRSPARIRSWIYTHGGKGFQLGADGKYATPDAATVAALQSFKDINDDKVMPKSVWTSGADPNALFKSGQVVAYYSGVWQVADFADGITDFDWASVPSPAQPTHATDINLGGKVVAFNNSDTSASAKKWVEFIFNRDNYTKLAQASGYLPIEQNLTLTYPFEKQTALDAFALYNKEIAAADPISSSGQATQTTLLLDGKKLVEDSIKDEMAKFINNEQDVNKTVENILTGLNTSIG